MGLERGARGEDGVIPGMLFWKEGKILVEWVVEFRDSEGLSLERDGAREFKKLRKKGKVKREE